MKKLYIILSLIAICALVIYAVLPDRHFVESVFPLEEGVVVDSFDDVADGGSSKVAFMKSDSLLHFQCALGQDEDKATWCGILWNFDPENKKNFRNWTFVDTIVLNMEVSGTKELLVKVWTFDPDVSSLDNYGSYRLHLKEVPVRNGVNKISLPMEQLYTPDFWYNDNNVKKSYKRRHLESVARVEIAPGWNQARGRRFTIAVHEMSAKGVSNLAFGMVLILFVILTIVAIGFTGRKK